MSPLNSTERHSSASSCNGDPRVELTFNVVDWDALLEIACNTYGVQRAEWTEQKDGGYNLVRFLRLMGNGCETEVVTRVPLLPEEGPTKGQMQTFSKRIESEVATMQYIEERAIRSPYIIMSKVEGTPLCTVWDDMEDDKRDMILRQVVDIYLELASHRFDKIGALFRHQDQGENSWYVGPSLAIKDENASQPINDTTDTTYSSGTDYWISRGNAELRKIYEQDFGNPVKMFDHAHVWFLRSLIPSLYDASLDVSGFPLLPGDFHSQNILISDVETAPRITAVIDWEFTETACTSSFAQYPFFIVDHPAWPDDHPLRPRNVRDQVAFNEFMLEAERKRDPTGCQPLSKAFANCQGVYLFEQCIADSHSAIFSALYAELFKFVFGDEEGFSADYYWALMENGILRKVTKQFDREVEVWEEARSALEDEIGDKCFTRSEFVKLAESRKDRFPKGGLVHRCLEEAILSEETIHGKISGTRAATEKDEPVSSSLCRP